nr:M15 family metallopeptidase [uncultured Anaeromusa sp.]
MDKFVKISWTVVLFLVLALWQSSALAADERLVGVYGEERDQFLIRERSGELELLYKVENQEDQAFANFCSYPLKKAADASYELLLLGPTQQTQAKVRFLYDAALRVTGVMLEEKRYGKQSFAQEEGKTFRIQPQLPLAGLRQKALQASMPIEKGEFLKPDLVEVKQLDSTLQLDIRYATDNNFMGMPLYEEGRAFLQRPAAEALVRVHRELEKYGYGLIIYDAYRPWYVTKMFWEATPEAQKVFVADPAKGSRHNRGGAVDIGLYSRKTGQSVAMGSGYDEFSLRAFSWYPGGTSAQRERRELLRLLMAGEGFAVYPEEWWHFDYAAWRSYPLLNIPFHEL